MQVFTIPDLMHRGALVSSDQVAISDPDRSLTYKELEAEAERVAWYLVSQGVAKGDRVGIHTGNSVDQVVLLLGVAISGAAFVNINPKFRERQVAHVIEDAGIEIVLREVPEEAAEVPLPRVIDRDLAALIYTSGSTGKPKGIMYTHGDAMMLARTNIELYQYTEKDVILSTMPWSSDYPLTTLYSMMLVGGTMVLRDTFMPSDIVNALVDEKVTGYASATPMWSILYGEKSQFHETEFPALRFIMIGGGYPPRHVMQQIMDKFEGKADIYTLYGLTEGHWSAYLPPDKLRDKYGSIGVPIPNVELFAVNEDGDVCQPGEEGVLVHRGGVVGRGYWQNPEKTVDMFRTGMKVVPEPLRDQETVMYTGDVVTVDEDGYLFFKGRADKQIKVQGYRVATEDIVDAMYDTGLIESGCVFAVEAEVDQNVIACVTSKQIKQDIRDKVVKHLKKQLPSYMVPSELFVLKKMPFTLSQKIDIERLKTWYEENKLSELEIIYEKQSAR